MRIKTFSYRYAEEILQHPKHIEAYKELMEVCEACPIPRFQGKSENQTSKDVVQQLMNTYFLEVLKLKGWEEEPLVTPDKNEDSLRADFRKSFHKDSVDGAITLQIEVEFGNIASSYRNYFKFQLSYLYDLTDVCVLIVPSYHLANRIDSGVSNFEKVLREIPSAKLSITVPTLVIGLFDVDESGKEIEVWDVKSECQDIQIVQNRNKTVAEAHTNLVRAYIEKISVLNKKS